MISKLRQWFKGRASPTPGSFNPSTTFLAGRDAPAGSIGWQVDCSGNPLDLRPAVETILRAIDEILPTVPSGSPLVVLMGEAHTMPAQILLLPLLATRLAERGSRFSVAFEDSYDFWARQAQGIPETLRQEPWHLHDADGLGVLSVDLACTIRNYAPCSSAETKATVYDLVRQSEGRVKALFNDAAKTEDYELDFSDPMVRSFLKRNWLRAMFFRSIRQGASVYGMACRNDIMAKLALEHTHRYNVPVLLQKTGDHHVLGHGKRLPFGDSLYSCLLRESATVLPLIHQGVDCDDPKRGLPSAAYGVLRHSVVIRGLSDARFGLEEWEESAGLLNQGWEQKAAEISFVRALLRESGLSPKFRDHTTDPFECAQWRTKAKSHADQILNRVQDLRTGL